MRDLLFSQEGASILRPKERIIQLEKEKQFKQYNNNEFN